MKGAADRPGPVRRFAARFGATRLDAALIAAAAAAFIASALLIYGGPSSAYAVVSTDSGEWVFPLAEDREFVVEGALGPVVVRIEGGAVYFHESPCKNQLCVGAAPVSSPGQWSACLPSGVFIRVEGGAAEEDEFDALVR